MRPSSDIPAFRAAVHDWATRLHAEYFAYGSGQKTTFAIAPIYADHAEWFTAECLRARDERWSSAAGDEAHVLRRGLQWTAEGYLERAVESLTMELAEAEARLIVEWEGKPLPYFSTHAELAGEPDPTRRLALHERCMEAQAPLEALREARLHQRHEAARAAGYTSYLALHERVLGIEFDGLLARLLRILAATEEEYVAQLGAFLETHAESRLAAAHRADTAFLMAYTPPTRAFRGDRITAALDRTLINLGLAPLAELPITLDLEPRPTKHTRAFCCGIDIPHDVRLSHAPVGGMEDYAVTFHEMGHALHFAHTRETLPPEDRYIGDRALTETYAFLMQAFVSTPGWLDEVLGIEEAAAIVEHTRLTRLYMLRRYVAKLAYEIPLHTLPPDADLSPAREEYAQRLTAATHFATDGRDALHDLDDGFYCADYLRAWCADAQLRRRLNDQFGPTWYREPAVGALLRSWWAEGAKWTVDDLAAAAGVGVIHPDALIAELLGAGVV